jgi:hypothetical protein
MCSKPERGFDLLPDRQGEEERHEDEEPEEHQEPDARSLELPLVLDAGTPLGAGVDEPPLDRQRVDGRSLVAFGLGSWRADGCRL